MLKRKILYAMLTIIWLMVVNGMIIPMLISAKSDEAVIAGMAAICAEVFVVVWFFLKSVIKYNPELNKKEEKKE